MDKAFTLQVWGLSPLPQKLWGKKKQLETESGGPLGVGGKSRQMGQLQTL